MACQRLKKYDREFWTNENNFSKQEVGDPMKCCCKTMFITLRRKFFKRDEGRYVEFIDI
jgi:hypothetical protein